MSKIGILKNYGGAGSRHGGARRITHERVARKEGVTNWS